MRTWAAVLLTVIGSAWGLACGGNGASGPVVNVSPATLPVSTGDGATIFAATLSNGAVDPVTWTLSGPGSISTNTGEQTTYLPPALGEGAGTARLTATAPCGTGCIPVGDTAVITISAATTGTLTITVQLQAVGPASLTVTGPNGAQNVSTSSSVVLPGLAPGAYTVTAADVAVTDPIVNSKYTAPPASVQVAANAAASVTVTYSAQPGYGMLWTVGGTLDSLDGFASGDLTVNKTPSVTPATSGAVQGIAFDAAGNMWASLQGTPGSVVSYAPAGLANSGPPPLTPTVTLSDANISDPAGVAIGPDGRLWVANCTANAVAAYPLTGGSASVVISSLSGTVFKCPRGIAFDTAGNLWVANRDGVANRIPQNQLSATNNGASPDVSLTAPTSPASSQPYGVALDTSGNVWVSFCQGSTVARYDASGLPGTTTPAVFLSPVTAANPRTLDCPVALALDNSGQLWVANQGTNVGPTLSGFATSDLATGGMASPIVEITSTGATVGGLAFNPAATNLPLRH